MVHPIENCTDITVYEGARRKIEPYLCVQGELLEETADRTTSELMGLLNLEEVKALVMNKPGDPAWLVADRETMSNYIDKLWTSQSEGSKQKYLMQKAPSGVS